MESQMLQMTPKRITTSKILDQGSEGQLPTTINAKDNPRCKYSQGDEYPPREPNSYVSCLY